MKINKFEDLKVWQDTIAITKLIYDLTATERFSKDFSLRDQMRRAIVSVSSNIVEGFERHNNNEFIRYLKIAKGSSGEVRNQLYIAFTICYINQQEHDELSARLVSLSSQIGSFVSYLEKQRRVGNFVKK